MTTMTFSDFEGKGRFICPVDKLDDKPGGCEVVFAKGADDETHQPKRYTAILQPGAKTGTWTSGNVSGTLEHVERVDEGVEHTISGVWVEDGQRKRFELFFWK